MTKKNKDEEAQECVLEFGMRVTLALPFERKGGRTKRERESKDRRERTKTNGFPSLFFKFFAHCVRARPISALKVPKTVSRTEDTG